MAITIIGTSHISPKSAQAVQKAIRSANFDIVAVELDHRRLHQLMHDRNRKPSFFSLAKAVGLWGALFAVIGRWIEHRMGSRVGMLPGEEMLSAVEQAKKFHLKIFLIDQPIEITLRRVSEVFTWRVRLRFLRNLFSRVDVGHIDLKAEPDQKSVIKMLSAFRKLSPELYAVLVSERDKHMADNIIKIQKAHPEKNILVVVGAGHLSGIRRTLHKTMLAEAKHNISSATKKAVQEE